MPTCTEYVYTYVLMSKTKARTSTKHIQRIIDKGKESVALVTSLWTSISQQVLLHEEVAFVLFVLAALVVV